MKGKAKCYSDSLGSMSFHFTYLVQLHDYSGCMIVSSGSFFFLVGAITTSQFFVGNSSNMEESDKLQMIGPLCQEEAKHCIV